MEKGYDLKKTRKNLVAKDNRLIQNARSSLKSVANKAVSYMISKIKPDDKPDQVYIFNCREFLDLILWNKDSSYKDIKDLLREIGNAGFWFREEIEGRKKDVLLRWFNTVHMDPGSGEIAIKFHEDMFPYLMELSKRREEEEDRFFSSYYLEIVSVMKHRYSQPLYELLKSYQFNNKKWTFENGTGTEFDLQIILATAVQDKATGKMQKPEIPEGWANYAIFKRNVLNPAVEEINKYSDIKVKYVGKKEDIHHRKTRAIRTIEFYMDKKTETEQEETDQEIEGLYRKRENESNYHQMTMEEVFFEERRKLHEEDKEYRDAIRNEKEVSESRHPELYAVLNREREANFDEEKVNLLYQTAIRRRVAGIVKREDWELFATDLITYYFDKIAATPEDTKVSAFNRLLSCIREDYDHEADRLLEEYGRSDIE